MIVQPAFLLMMAFGSAIPQGETSDAPPVSVSGTVT